MIYIIVLLSVFLLDLMVKKYVEANLEEGEEKSILGGRILIRKLHNDGIALGKFSEYKEEIKKVTTAILAGSVLSFIVLLFKKGRELRKLGLAVFLGGALCNWFDRFHQQTVTDYFSFQVKWKKLKDLVFNISDLCIAGGLLLALLGRKRKSSGK